MEKKRPISVTIIAWYLIVSNVLLLIFSMYVNGNNQMSKEFISASHLSIPMFYILFYFGIAVSVIGWMGMLKGQDWARLINVIWAMIGFATNFVTSPMKGFMIPGLVLIAMGVFFLYRPASNQYFTK